MRRSRKRKPQPTPFAVHLVANERIRVPEVRVIDGEGKHLGVLPTKRAVETAMEMDMDLILIDPKGNPPVAKIANFGQFKYQKEKEQKQRKAQMKVSETKGIRLTSRIADHDITIRLKRATTFLEEGNRVQVEILMRGRDNAHPDIIRGVVENFLTRLQALTPIKMEQPIQRLGAKFTAVVAKKSE